MRRYLWLSILLSALTVATSVGAQDTLKPNQTYRDMIRLTYSSGSTQIPLPPGDWVLAGYNEFLNNKDYRLVRGYLIRTTLNVLTGLISFRLPTEFETYGWEVPALCDKEDMLFHERLSAYEGGDSDCWGISRVKIRLRKSSSDAMRMLADYISGNSITIPSTMMSVKYSKTNSSNFLIISYYFHPDIDGTDPTNYFAFTNINLYKAWGRKWKPKVDAGFLGKLEVTKTKETLAPPEQTPKAVTSGEEKGDIGQRIIRLLKLYDEGLITESEYFRKLNRILEGL